MKGKKNFDYFSFAILFLILVIFIFSVYNIDINKNIQKSPKILFECPTETQQLSPTTNLDKQKITAEVSYLQNLNTDIKKLNLENLKNQNKVNEIRTKLLERKKFLIKTSYTSPEAALVSTISNSNKDYLKSISNNCIEQLTEVEGTLEILHIDFFEEKRSENRFYLLTSDNRRITLHPAVGLKDKLISGMKIRVNGFIIDNELIFDGTKSIYDNSKFGGIDVLESQVFKSPAKVEVLKEPIKPLGTSSGTVNILACSQPITKLCSKTRSASYSASGSAIVNCDNSRCNTACGFYTACDGNIGGCIGGTVVKYTGACVSPSCNCIVRFGVYICTCGCSCSANSNYLETALGGNIFVSTTPSGAYIYLDGETISRGISPLAITNLPTGNHLLIAKLSGYYDATENVEVLTEQTSNIYLNLRPTYLLPPVLGEQRTLVVLVNFQDTPQPSITLSQVEDIIFNPSNPESLNNYYKENSYNKLWLSGNVMGWYTLPITQTCDLYLLEREVINFIDPIVDFSSNRYSRIIMVSQLDCYYIGISTVGPVIIQTNEGSLTASISLVDVSSLYSPLPYYLVGHELGHGLGEFHANFWYCPENYLNINQEECSIMPYGDFYDIMGSVGSSRKISHFNAVHKDHIGWLGNNIVQIDRPEQSGNYVLSPIEISDNNLKVIKIKRSENNYLYIENREPIGFDSNDGPIFGTDIYEGALLHMPEDYRFYHEYGDTVLLDPTAVNRQNFHTPALRVGESIIDPTTGTTISVISKSISSLTVEINFGPKTDFTNPNVQINSPITYSTVSGTITLSAIANDDFGIEKVEFYYLIFDGSSLSEGMRKLATITQPPYQISWDMTNVPNTEVLIYAKAYDTSGVEYGLLGNRAYSENVFILVENSGDNIPPNVNLIAPIDGSIFQPNLAFDIVADASDNLRIWKVEFYKDSDNIPFWVSTEPYEGHYSIGTTFNPGVHTIYAKAYDYQGNSAISNTVTIYIGVCRDGTLFNQCTTSRPYYCDSSGNLIVRCSICSCNFNEYCQSDGTCRFSFILPRKKVLE